MVDFVGCLGVAMSGCLLVFFGEVLFFSGSPLLVTAGVTGLVRVRVRTEQEG